MRYPPNTPIPKPVKQVRKPKAMPRFNAARKARLKELREGDSAPVIRRLPCFACLAESPNRGVVKRQSLAAHMWHTRGSGGVEADQIPNCPRHEEEIGTGGRVSFSKKYGMNLEVIARDLAALFESEPKTTTAFFFWGGLDGKRQVIRVLIQPPTQEESR